VQPEAEVTVSVPCTVPGQMVWLPEIEIVPGEIWPNTSKEVKAKTQRKFLRQFTRENY